MSVALIHETVRHGTTLDDGFLTHAAHQAMTVYLHDWEAAAARLNRQIEALRAARDARRAAREAGDWPPRRECEHCGDTADVVPRTLATGEQADGAWLCRDRAACEGRAG